MRYTVLSWNVKKVLCGFVISIFLMPALASTHLELIRLYFVECAKNPKTLDQLEEFWKSHIQVLKFLKYLVYEYLSFQITILKNRIWKGSSERSYMSNYFFIFAQLIFAFFHIRGNLILYWTWICTRSFYRFSSLWGKIHQIFTQCTQSTLSNDITFFKLQACALCWRILAILMDRKCCGPETERIGTCWNPYLEPMPRTIWSGTVQQIPVCHCSEFACIFSCEIETDGKLILILA